jgi:hypothetical protein
MRGAAIWPARKLARFEVGERVAAVAYSRYARGMTVTVTLDLPPDAEAESPDELVRRLRMLWALDEVRQGRLTRVRAASVLGLSLDGFLSEASKHGLDAIDYDLDDFRRELASGP